jgi:hypothetical protein
MRPLKNESEVHSARSRHQVRAGRKCTLGQVLRPHVIELAVNPRALKTNQLAASAGQNLISKLHLGARASRKQRRNNSSRSYFLHAA